MGYAGKVGKREMGKRESNEGDTQGLGAGRPGRNGVRGNKEKDSQRSIGRGPGGSRKDEG